MNKSFINSDFAMEIGNVAKKAALTLILGRYDVLRWIMALISKC
jgi:hypothetical protein